MHLPANVQVVTSAKMKSGVRAHESSQQPLLLLRGRRYHEPRVRSYY